MRVLSLFKDKTAQAVSGLTPRKKQCISRGVFVFLITDLFLI